MIKERAAMLAVCAILLFCVLTAGCSGNATSPTPTATATPSASVSATNYTVKYFYKNGCIHCEALANTTSFAQLQKEVPVQRIEETNNVGYGVVIYPTLILYNNGAEVQRWIAPEDATSILARINGN
ncbi:MAG: thioredoxin domain-containing protein [Halobacteriota archaeon]